MNWKCFLGLHNTETTYAAEASCDQIQKCKRCGREWSQGKKHVLEKWIYVSTEACTQVSTCARCGEMEKRFEQHEFSSWQNISIDEHKSTCTRCGVEVVSQHNWIDIGVQGEIYHAGANYDVIAYECEKCGAYKDNASQFYKK